MVGASLRRGAGAIEARVALMEAVPHDAASQPSFDERTTALSNGSRRILETLGVWAALEASRRPSQDSRLGSGTFRLCAHRCVRTGLAAMGYVVPNRALGSALWSRLVSERRKGCRRDILVPREVSRISAESTGLSWRSRGRRRCDDRGQAGGGRRRRALGRARRLRRGCGVPRLRANRRHHHGAAAALPRQRGLRAIHAQGPLALLPLEGGRCTLVLTLSRGRGAIGHGLVGRGISRRGATPLRVSPGAIPQSGTPGAVSAVLDSVGSAPARGAASSSAMPRRGCTRSRAWVSIWACAMWRAWPNSLPRRRGCESDPGGLELLARVRWLASGRPRRRHRVHGRTGADVRQSSECGAAPAQLGSPGVRPAASRKGRVVALEHRRGGGPRIPKLARGVALQ